MSLPRYPEYKHSGVNWLGEVPSHWEVAPLKRSFKIVGGSTPKSDRPEYWDGSVVWVSPADLSKLTSIYIDDSARKITEEGLASCGTTMVPSGSIVLSTRAPIGSLAIAAASLCTNQGCKALVPSHDVNSQFFAYLLLAATDELNIRGRGTTFLELSSDELGAFKATLPCPEEQAAIASFLNRETGKIDALIAEQEKLLALLAEKRHATISHAVTKGLNPDMPMKDSGVAWLGEVPEHWEIKQLRHTAKIVRGASPRPAGDPKFFSEDAEGNTPWVTVAEVTKDTGTYLDSVKEYLTPLGVEQSQHFESGTLVFTNSGATLGVPKILAINCCANDGILAFRDLVQTVNIVFLYSFLLTTTERLRTEMKQGGGQPNLNTDIVKNIGFALPPLDEQSEIVAFLNQELARIDALASEASRGISVLKERRSALIAAAVTGQIDVRAPVTEPEAS